MYDIATTGVTTSDKKSMSANAYVTWRIVDVEKYYKTLNSVETAQSRIDTSVYSAIKNVISSTTQDEVITGKDGTISASILKKVNLASYGIEVTNVEIKLLDLPEENKNAVYDRMISERSVIASQYTAKGKKAASMIETQAAADARETISNAEAEAYSKSESKTKFYTYWTELGAMKQALSNGGTLVITEDNPLYQVLIDAN